MPLNQTPAQTSVHPLGEGSNGTSQMERAPVSNPGQDSCPVLNPSGPVSRLCARISDIFHR